MKTHLATSALVLDRLTICLPHLQLNPSETLGSLRIDSLDYVEMLCTIDSEFGVRLTESDLNPSITLQHLANHIASHSPLLNPCS